MTLTRSLYSLVVLNAFVWIIWAIGSHGGGIPWPAWVSFASVAAAGARFSGGGRSAPGGGRQRNRNRDRDRDRS